MALPNKPARVVLLSALALSGALRLVVTPKPSREHCAQCGQQIPPGRAGRRCVECRAADAKA